MIQPLVSIIIPAFNHKHFVQDTLKSLLAQTYAELELIILDDHSSDGTVRRIRELEAACRNRFRRVVIEEQAVNLGVARTLNRALDMAQGPLIYHLASDDIALPSAVATLVELMGDDPTVGMACGDASFIDNMGHPTTAPGSDGSVSFVESFTAHRRDFDVTQEFGSYASLLGGNYIPIGLLVRKASYDVVGRYRPELRMEDWDFWLRLSKRYSMRFLPEPLALYRVHASNSVRTLRHDLIRDTIKILRQEREHAIGVGLRKRWEASYTGALRQAIGNISGYRPAPEDLAALGLRNRLDIYRKLVKTRLGRRPAS